MPVTVHAAMAGPGLLQVPVHVGVCGSQKMVASGCALCSLCGACVLLLAVCLLCSCYFVLHLLLCYS